MFRLFAGVMAAVLPWAALAQQPTPVDGGTLTVAVQVEPRTLLPLLDTNTRTSNVSAKVVEGLLTFDANFQPQPLLATGWTISADGLTYTFTLRPNVRWHDGKPFTAEDVRFSLLTQQKVGPRGRITLAGIERIDTPDPLTAVVVLREPAPYLLKALTSGETPIVPAHAYAGHAEPSASPNNNAPIGTGPFVFDSWVRGSHVILRKNPHYWKPGKPHLDTIIYKLLPDTAAISAALESGEADMSNDLALPDLERLGRHPQLKVESTLNAYLNNAQFLEFNLAHPVLARREVRQAIVRAVNRQFLKDSVYFGHTEIFTSPISRALTSYHDDSAFNYPFDVALANRLLDEAGVTRGADGVRFSGRISFLPGAAFRKTAGYVRAALGRVGIKLELVDGDLGTYSKRIYQDRGFDININGLSTLFDPTVGVQRIYWSDGIVNRLPYVNASHYNNPAVDNLFRQAAVAVDESARAALFKRIQGIVGEDVPAYPLVAVPTITVTRARVNQLYNSVTLNAGDFSDAWLTP